MQYKSNPPIVDVAIRRTVDLSRLSVLDEERAGSEDGIALNLSYGDARGWSLDDARLMVDQERELLEELSEAQWTTEEASAIVDDYISGGSELLCYDPGVGGAVFALSAAGATPISSCNGGTIGSECHSSDTPNILMAAGPTMRVAAIEKALELANVGIIPNGEFAEIFADDILKFHTFAQRLMDELKVLLDTDDKL
ncbi:hypothetical protein ACU8OQ_37090 (plasmid) [Rhizobium leguminosarum]